MQSNLQSLKNLNQPEFHSLFKECFIFSRFHGRNKLNYNQTRIFRLFLGGFLRLPLYHVMAWVWIIGCRRDFLKGRWDGKNWLEMGSFKKRGDVVVRVRRPIVICHVTMQRCCFVWVFFVWNSRLRSKSTPGPRQQLGTMSFLSLLRWKKTHIPNRLSWKHMNQMETHPMAKRRGQASVQLFGCSVTTTCGL